MPGFLTKMFEPEPHDGSSFSAQGHDESTTTDADADANVELALNVHVETAVEYQAGDESGGWSNATDVTLVTSTDAVLAAAAEAGLSEDAGSA